MLKERIWTLERGLKQTTMKQLIDEASKLSKSKPDFAIILCSASMIEQISKARYFAKLRRNTSRNPPPSGGTPKFCTRFSSGQSHRTARKEKPHWPKLWKHIRATYLPALASLSTTSKPYWQLKTPRITSAQLPKSILPPPNPHPLSSQRATHPRILRSGNRATAHHSEAMKSGKNQFLQEHHRGSDHLDYICHLHRSSCFLVPSRC